MSMKTSLSQLLTLALLLTNVAPAPARSAVMTRATQEGATQEDSGDEPRPQGFRFRLSEGAAPKGRAPQEGGRAAAPAQPLSDAETARLLARLPPFAAEPGDERAFSLRESPEPPPRAGQTIAAAFSPPDSGAAPPPAPHSAPLEVLRFAPVGEVALAPAVSVTFSQPMVAVSSQEEAAAQLPVRLTPRPAGRWVWLGSQTLVFRPEAEGGRLPAATAYTVELPAGLKSAAGRALARTRTFNFSTPPPALKHTHPQGEGRARDPVIFMELDQRVDAARLLGMLRLETAPAAAGARLRQATAEEVAADEEVSRLVRESQPGRWLALRAVTAGGSTRDALPAGAKVTVVLPAGAPSAEGPRVTAAPQSFSFKTYDALRVAGQGCGRAREAACAPTRPLRVGLNNRLDARHFDSSQVTVTPRPEGMRVSLAGAEIQVEGRKRGGVVYTVTLPRGLRDAHGQTLAGDNRVAFRVGHEEPNVYAPGRGFVVLDPARRSSFSVYSVNTPRLRVSLYRVTPEDWGHFCAYEAMRRNRATDAKVKAQLRPPGALVWRRVLEPRSAPDELVETPIDLSAALDGGYGHAFVRVEPVERGDAPVRVYAYGPGDGAVDTWAQSTDIGLDAFVDGGALVAWANSLGDGRPLAGVAVTALPEEASGVTGADGVARIPFGASRRQGRPVLIARRGADSALLPQDSSPVYGRTGRDAWRRGDAESSLAWHVFDDRSLYRPGEEVSVKGWVRRVGLTPEGDTELFRPREGEALSYVVKDSAGEDVARGAAPLNPLAGFDLKFRLPPTARLGGGSVELRLEREGAEHTHRFRVMEFRRPELELKARGSEAPHFVGGSATATVEAAYYSGGALADAGVEWDVRAEPASYTPPGRADYTFGKWAPWWEERRDGPDGDEGRLKGRTDAEGRHVLRLDFDSAEPPRPTSVTAFARVEDVNRQAVGAYTRFLVHPSEVYVGLRAARSFARAGRPFDLGLVVTDIDGRAAPGRDVAVRLARIDHVYEAGAWKEREVDVLEQVVRSGEGETSLRLPTGGGGAYRLTARVRDGRGRPNETELTLWVEGGRRPRPPAGAVEQEKVELIPDREEYRPGDVAEILVRAPFAPAEGLLTLRRSGVLRAERFTMSEATRVLRVPLEEGMTPNVRVQVDLVGAAPRSDDEGREPAALPKRPAYASGGLDVALPPASRRLSVKATPRAEVLEPGGETFVDVEVLDAAGRAVAGTDTAVVVVDESVLALAGYRLRDPLAAFYPEREPQTDDYHLREHVKLASPAALAPGGNEGGGIEYPTAFISHHVQNLMLLETTTAMTETVEVSAGVASETEAPEVTLRRNFNALAVFAASSPTDAAGRARVLVKLPDNLTRYRVMAVSVAGGRLAGAGESAITARLPLMARPSAPRFLNFGDRFELPVVVQSRSDRETVVDVAVRAANAELTAGAGRRVRVPANGRVEVLFPAAAARPGVARFQVAASDASGAASDAAEVSLPVHTPATAEAFATYGVIDEGAAAQPVKVPAGVVRDFGGLEVQTSSTQLQELTDAFVYLYRYPYGCSEQLASRVISVVALADVLAAFGTKDLPAPEEMRGSVRADLARLGGLQNYDGGFGFWRRGETSSPFVTAHVAHALVRARAKQFRLPGGTLDEALDYLRDVGTKIPKEYSPASRRAVEAYALHVRALAGEPDAARARRLVAEAGGVEKLSLESLGWLLPTLAGDAGSAAEAEAARRHLHNRVTETAGAAHFTDSYADGEHAILHSDRRADGVILDALVGDRPESDLIPKLVRGLLDGRRRGRWESTQENVFILLALERYFKTYERETPDFVARVWLGRGFAGEQSFKGRAAGRRRLDLPMAELAARTKDAPAPLVIAKEGAGRLYFRVGTTYAPASLKLDAADYGFRVARVYEAVDDPSDVRRDAEGVWRVRAGSRVRVRVRFFNPARRYHVALVDPMPAGLEALNPELATTGPLPEGASEEGSLGRGGGVSDYHLRWRGAWFEHQSLRDDRAEAFASLLWEGEHEYSYFARATTPGTFVVPPSKAEEMYSPETFGRGQSDRVVVELSSK